MSTQKINTEYRQAGIPDAPEVANESEPCILGWILETDLNHLWAERYARDGHDLSEGESVVTEREKNRTTWELSLVNLGYPKLKFNISGRKLYLCKNLLTDLRLELSTPNGMAARQAIRIEQSDGSVGKILEVTLSLDSTHVEYHLSGGSEVKVHWSKPATYVIQGDPLNADRFEQHYEVLKRMKLARLPKPVSDALANAWVYFLADGDKLYPSVYRQPGTAAARLDQFQTSAEARVGMRFATRVFPIDSSQQPPEDKDWVIGLFAPSRSATWVAGSLFPPPDYYLGAYVLSDAMQARTTSAIRAQALRLSPLVSFCDRGGPLEKVELMPAAAQATWGAEGTLCGKLLPQGGSYY
ncbi:hypothetical protein [Pseudomonas sp. SID14000]|uniref:hypothetical protein n=1 Tax=Pseudomonas sp. SID14000 TaxID=1986221 RepID=UPI000B3D09F9|nr:hypothetical protein [Pseudomonas sp. SID14000]